MTRPTALRAALLGAATSLLLAGSALADASATVNTPPPASMTNPTVAPTPGPDMKAVLDAQAALGAKPIETLTPAQARRQPTVTDGAMALMKRKGMSTAPEPGVKVDEASYPAGAGTQRARIYRPSNAPRAKGLPVIVYYHGGGWVIADVMTYDATPRFLAKQLNAIVVSVEYRHAPEAKFPAQHEDAAAAYRWVVQNAATWGGDPRRLVLAGESAGGNLAVATAIYARDNRLPAPVHILAVYPIANSDMTLPSKVENFNAKPLNTPMLAWFGNYWSRSPADMQDPRINLVAADLHGLPPTTIVNAQIDPLRSDGETLATALQTAGDSVEQRTFPSVTHEFFGLGKGVRGAYDAEQYAAQRLQAALAAPPAPQMGR